ncbi:MAG: HesB/IscA family protein [Pirellulales bacterium]
MLLTFHWGNKSPFFPFPNASPRYNLDEAGAEITPTWERLSIMAVKLTEKAASEILRIIAEQKLDDDIFLRIAVAGGGCSGFQYSLGFDKELDAKLDAKFESNGVTIVVDRKSDLYLDGTTIDFFDGTDRRGFAFDNPNAVKSCGCGGAFSA